MCGKPLPPSFRTLSIPTVFVACYFDGKSRHFVTLETAVGNHLFYVTSPKPSKTADQRKIAISHRLTIPLFHLCLLMCIQ